MTNWKRLLETNPEPSLLDAIAHAEKQKPTRRTKTYANSTR